MTHIKSYFGAFLSETLIGVTLLSELEMEIKLAAGVIGVVVGIFTAWKIILDIRIKNAELKKLKEK